MNLFATLIATLRPIAHAAGVEDVGGGISSLPAMWDMMTLYLPYRTIGSRGLGPTTVTNIVINTVLGIIGAVAVLVIIFAAIQLATSAGNEEAVTKAKKIILYAAIGLILAVLANTIVYYLYNCVGDLAGGSGGLCLF
jgi:hypothetical protein